MYRLSRRSSPGDIHGRVLLPEKVERKVIDHSPIEVLVHVAEAVALLRENKQVETLVGADEGIHHAEGIARVNVVVDIAVGSLNQVKVSAVRTVMERVYGEVRITAVDVPSGVPPQPFESQTHEGSRNRALAALGDHDMGVGIEAGVFEMLDGLYDVQHCTIVSRDGRETYGQGSGFRYPDSIAGMVRGGMTVGDAVHEVYGDTDIGKKQGAVGLLSKGLIDRKTLTEQSVIAAMIPRIWDE